MKNSKVLVSFLSLVFVVLGLSLSGCGQKTEEEKAVESLSSQAESAAETAESEASALKEAVEKEAAKQ
ncbi:hypothetical protein [Pelagicoccus sp. SDUM812002]|uniref:hypothetical protein n=1 Tax=Pelagicoccus sp. SDUM812002 TaxID=3041266 RepID=UPI00280D6C4A|nr:hypothetical protein [Pelagicoccus sp. SDUM812002]MDQ8187278.1 hypothetical protein [Pelagicoccus sp. SDUM812002]